jgi:hypothetical protein
MERIKNYKAVIIIIVAVMILVIIRSAGSGHFKPDAAKWARPSFNGSELITPEDFASLQGYNLVIALDDHAVPEIPSDISKVRIAPDSILAAGNLKLIRKNEGPVALVSADPSVSAKMWMLLKQMGIKDLYIMTSENANEASKNKFRPDTLFRPEL